MESDRVTPSKTLDLCCGVGTNPIYLAQKAFDVTALNISDKAVAYAKEKAQTASVDTNPLVGDYLTLPFTEGVFDFAFDFGCFHHVEATDRTTFIEGVYRVLKPASTYLLVCFSYRNGSSWNYFTNEQIVKLFSDLFEIESIRHISSIEADRVTRYFYEVLMRKAENRRLTLWIADRSSKTGKLKMNGLSRKLLRFILCGTHRIRVY